MFILDETTEEETSQSEEESEEELSEETQVSEPEAEPPKPKKTKPQKKPFERNDSIYLATVRYKSLGLPANQKRLSSSRKKEIEDKLEKNQEKLKSVCLTFFLFSNIFKYYFQIYPNFYATRNKLKKMVDKIWKEKKVKRSPKKSNPPQENFKMRLERILESPVHKPGSIIKPIPVPRKKVMFDTPKPPIPSTSKRMYEEDTTSNASSF